MTRSRGLLFLAAYVASVAGVVWIEVAVLCLGTGELGCTPGLAPYFAGAAVVVMAPLAAFAVLREAGRVLSDGREGHRLASSLALISGALALAWPFLGIFAVAAVYGVALPAMRWVGHRCVPPGSDNT